jgi:ABC-type multidrug transport system fused ATPase/permease subunit
MAILFNKHEFIEELVFSFITLLFYSIFLYIFYFYYAIYIEEDIVKLQSANLCTYITSHLNLFSIFIKKDKNGDFVLNIPKNDYIDPPSTISITDILTSFITRSSSDNSSVNSKIDKNNTKLQQYALLSIIILVFICLFIISMLCYYFKINPSFIILKSTFLVICIAVIEIVFLQQVSSNVVTINVTKPIAAFLESIQEAKNKK